MTAMTNSINYTGYLKDYIEDISSLTKQNLSRKQIAEHLHDRGVIYYHLNCQRKWRSHTFQTPLTPEEEKTMNIAAMLGMITHLQGRLNLIERKDNSYGEARIIHAFLLRCEEKTFREVGLILGVTAERARLLTIKGSKRIQRAVRHTKIKVSYDPKSGA